MMKKNISTWCATALLAVGGLVLASCSKNTDFSDNTKGDAYQQATAQYEAQFEAKYGSVANKNWDLTTPVYLDGETYEFVPTSAMEEESAAALTRGNVITKFSNSPYLTVSMLSSLRWTKKQWEADLTYVQQHIATATLANWDEQNVEVLDIWAAFTHGNGNTNSYFQLGIYSKGKDGKEYNTKIVQGNGKEERWLTGFSGVVAGAGYSTDATELKNAEESYWWTATQVPNNKNNSDLFKLEHFKVVTTERGSVYWCFDCDGDQDYDDLICLVKPVQIGKRYMIEDLGATGDFDFNDIVIDVFQEKIGDDLKQYTIVRAMGGTLDFTLTVGNTQWTKSHAFDAKEMINTKGTIDYDAELAKFEVQGWNPSTNNIAISVNNTAVNKVYNITFPKTGTVPMIIAVNPSQEWMVEKNSVPGSWFTE